MQMFTDISIAMHFLSIFRIFELFSKRNTVLFGIGASIFGVFVLMKMFLPVAIKTGKKSKWVYYATPVVGIALIVVSFFSGEGGWGFGEGSGNGTSSSNVTPVPMDNPDSKNEENIIDDTGRIRIYVKTGTIKVGNSEVDLNGLKDILNEIYKSELKIVLIDDYADSITYQEVKKIIYEFTLSFEEEVTK